MFFQKYIQSTEGDVPNMGFLILYGGLYISAPLTDIHASSPAINISLWGNVLKHKITGIYSRVVSVEFWHSFIDCNYLRV